MFQNIFKQLNLIKILMIFLVLPIFAQENNTSEKKEEISLNLKGASTQGAIAIIVSNRSPVIQEVRDMVTDFVKNNFRVALVPEDYTYDLKTLTAKNSPFVKEVAFVLKMNFYNKSLTEQMMNLNVEIVRLSDGKIVTQEISGPRSNVRFITVQIRNLLTKLMTTIRYDNPTISMVEGDLFAFPYKNFNSLRRGDEIIIRYANARKGLTESIGIVHKMSNDMVLVKDINKKVEVNDKVIRGTPRRNRFYLNLGLIVPTVGERVLTAKLDNNVWESSRYWPVGFKIEGEYERFLPYRLVSTTIFGINTDRTISTYLMTGIGYRIFKNSWEFTPYFRLGFMYSTIGLKNIEGNAGNLQGFALRFGVNLGINIIKRINSSMFVGLDLGLQYFPFETVSVLTGSEKVTPEWKNKKEYSEDFPMTELYPYLSLKVGWLF